MLNRLVFGISLGLGRFGTNWLKAGIVQGVVTQLAYLPSCTLQLAYRQTIGKLPSLILVGGTVLAVLKLTHFFLAIDLKLHFPRYVLLAGHGTTVVLGIQSNMTVSPIRMASCDVARGTTVYDIQELVIDQCDSTERKLLEA